MENEFITGRKKKSVLWVQVLNKIKEIDPEFSHSKEQIRRTFLNLRTTYKRIKQRIPVGNRFFSVSLFFLFFLKGLLFCAFNNSLVFALSSS